jgi:hypothetical protein
MKTQKNTLDVVEHFAKLVNLLLTDFVKGVGWDMRMIRETLTRPDVLLNYAA